MIKYRGYEVRQVSPLLTYVFNNTPEMQGIIGGFKNSVEAFRFIDSLLTDSVHPWRHDFRELVRLIRGECLLPHGINDCSICDEAFTMARRARQAKMTETYDALLNDQAMREEILNGA